MAVVCQTLEVTLTLESRRVAASENMGDCWWRAVR
jgi:hypothetical protein